MVASVIEAAAKFLIVVATLVAAGYLPAVAITRSAPIAVALAPLASGIVCAVAATAALLTRTTLVPWLAAAFLATWAVSFARVRGTGTAGGNARGWLPLAVFAAMTAVALLGLYAAPNANDARLIWFFHAKWFYAGGSSAVDAMRDPLLEFAHPDYPPLSSATAAFIWKLAGNPDLRLAKYSTGALTWGAVLSLSLAIFSLFRQYAPRLIVLLVAGSLGLGAYGMAGHGGTNGYVDLLLAASISAAAVYLLIAPPSREAIFTGATFLLVAALTKNEGIVMAFALGLLSFIRLRRIRLARFAIGLAVLAGPAWILVSKLLGAPSDMLGDPVLRGQSSTLVDRRSGGMLPPSDRVLDHAGAALSAFLSLSGLLVALALVIWLLARVSISRERFTAIGSELWLWSAALVFFLILLLGYINSPYDVDWHLATSAERALLTPKLLLLTGVSAWLLMGIAVLRSTRAWDQLGNKVGTDTRGG